MTRCGQEILKRSACEINPANGNISMRFEAGFPANGRTINARELHKILFEYLPECVKRAFCYKNLEASKVQAAVELAEDQQALREWIRAHHMVAFVADSAVLPRESGVSARPMKGGVAFWSPESLRVKVVLPHRGEITGMGIPEGITLIVGGGYHGKSTLLHMMGGLDTPTSGSVIVRGEELAKKNDDELTIFRRRNIGFIFQNYNLVPILNVYENIVLPVELDGDTVDQKFMDEVVYMLALEDKLENMPNNLSGGQQQRVAIARALITKPAIILADEPTGNLDSKTSADVLGLLKHTSGEFNQTIVMITHNNEIAQLADRIVRIEDGKIVG